MSDSRFAQGQELQDLARRDPEPPERPAEAPTAGDTADDTTGDAGAAAADLTKREGRQPPVAAKVATSGATGPADGTDGFFQPNATGQLRADWLGIQSDFVDDPRRAVEQADILVERAAAQLTEAVTARRRQLRDQWHPEAAADGGDTGGDSTEQLRTGLKEYRQLLNQLLET